MTARFSADLIEAQAAQWLMRREEDGWCDDDDDALEDWIGQSMAHRAAFWRLEHGWEAADRVAALGSVGSYPRRARARWLTGLGVAIRRHRLATGSVASALLAILIGVLWWSPAPMPGMSGVVAKAYRTPVGGQRRLLLADGSRVELNTATTLRAASRAGAREVWLDDGEAYFDIIHRPEHPFVVHAGPRTITVLGTRFVVRRAGEMVTVAVLSGRVRVDDVTVPAGVKPRSAIVTTGDVAVAQPRATLITNDTPRRVDAIAAWRDGMIVFDDTPLAEAAAEFSRYTVRPLRVADPALADLRIGGSFRTQDSAAFVELMERAYHVRVRDDGGAITLDR